MGCLKHSAEGWGKKEEEESVAENRRKIIYYTVSTKTTIQCVDNREITR